jgi:hypothetical protein
MKANGWITRGAKGEVYFKQNKANTKSLLTFYKFSVEINYYAQKYLILRAESC